MTKKSGSPVPSWLVYAVIGVIVLAWAGNFVARVLVQDYDPPEGIDGLMLAVVGFLFAGKTANDRAGQHTDALPSEKDDAG